MKRIVIIVILLNIFSLSYSLNGKKLLANRYLKRADNYLKNKDYFLAKRFYERAFRKFKVIRDHKGQFLSLKGLGDVNMYKGYFDRGFDMYNRASYFAHRSGMVYTYAFVELCRNVARVHESHRYYGNAVRSMQIAVNVGRKIGSSTIGADSKYLSKLQVLRKKHGDMPY